MKGSIRRRGQHSWELTVDLGYDSQGRRQREFLTFRGTKREAEAKLREVLSEHDKGKPFTNTKMTLKEYTDQWLELYAAPNTRPRTYEAYRYTARKYLLPYLGDVRLASLQASHIESLHAKLRELGLASQTILHVHRLVREIVAHAVKKGVIYYNAVDATDAPVVQPAERVVPDAHTVQRFLALIADSPYHALFSFVVATGCRRGEVLGLRWQDVNFATRMVSIVQTVQRVAGKGCLIQPPKTKTARRAIPLDAQTLTVLRAHRALQAEHRLRCGDVYEDHDLVFPGPLGEPLDPDTATHTFRALADRAGLKGVRLHDLRHFHATAMLEAGVHLKVVQERLGHSTIAVTGNIYSHVTPGIQREAVEVFAAYMKMAASETN